MIVIRKTLPGRFTLSLSVFGKEKRRFTRGSNAPVLFPPAIEIGTRRERVSDPTILGSNPAARRCRSKIQSARAAPIRSKWIAPRKKTSAPITSLVSHFTLVRRGPEVGSGQKRVRDSNSVVLSLYELWRMVCPFACPPPMQTGVHRAHRRPG